MIYTFYSFKGGVGRSMALASAAYLLAERGLRVLVIDFDLEAPGLERYFFKEDQASGVREKPGLIDLLGDYRRALTNEEDFEARAFRQWWQYVQDAAPGVAGDGRVDLMSAGRREPQACFAAYAQAVRSFDWHDFFHNWNGERFFDWLRTELTSPSGGRGYDVVLVDSRTGITEMGGVCAYQLADAAIMLCAANDQNIEGTLRVARDFRSEATQALRRGRELQILVIPARLESQNVRRNDFLRTFEEKFPRATYLPAELYRRGMDYEKLALPYDPEFAIIERLVGEAATTSSGQGALQNFQRLADVLVWMASRPGKLRSLQHVPTAAPVVPVADPTRSHADYDFLLDASHLVPEQRETLLQGLEARGLRVGTLTANLLPGVDFREAMQNLLEASQGLVLVLAQSELGERQRAELEQARQRGLRILPLRAGMANEEGGVGFVADLPSELAHLQVVTLDGDLASWPARIAALWRPAVVSAVEVAPVAPDDVRQADPYPGMRPFTSSEQGLFFGRQDQVMQWAPLLAASRVTLLVGAAGVGKTSFVEAGLLPVLDAVSSVPGRRVHRLDLASLQDDWPQSSPDQAAWWVLDHIDSFPAGCDEAALEDRIRSVGRLLDCLGPLDQAILIARDTFVESLLDAPPKRWTLGTDGRTLLRIQLLPLGDQELSATIERPAARQGHVVEPGVIPVLQTQWGSSPSAVAQLARVLPALWRSRRRGWLTAQAVQGPGGITAAVQAAWTRWHAGCSPAESHATSVLVRTLSTLGPAMQLAGHAQPWGRLVTLRGWPPGLDPVALRDRLVAERLLDLWRVSGADTGLPGNTPSQPGALMVGLALDQPALCGEVFATPFDAGFLRWRREFDAYVARWERSQRMEAEALSGPALAEAEAHAGRHHELLTEADTELIAQSRRLWAEPSEIILVVPARSAASRSSATPADAGATEPPGRRKARVEVAARRGTGALVRISARVGTDVVVLHVEGGPALVLHPLHARDLLLAQDSDQPVARGIAADAPGPGEVQVPTTLQWRGLDQPAAARSGVPLGKIVLSAIDVVTDLFTGRDVAEWTAAKLAERIDGNVVPGVYRLSPEQLAATRPGVAPGPISPPAGGRPVLVLLHGTFSSTVGTFGKLWAQHPARVRELFWHYADQVYALDHATLAASPIDNALMLVRALPKGVPVALHLVTHSRGGLVAEVLARVASTTLTLQDLAAFAGDDLHRQRTQLQALADALAERQVTVERVVRVACPARGTLLASRRLDAYLSVLQWSLQLADVPALPGLVDFLTAVARERFDPETLPGLAAMTPLNPLVQWLNNPREAIAGDLRVVAGDREGDSLGTWLKTLVADAFYWTDNDIVVQTSSMYGGTPRSAGAHYLLDQGGGTTHFAYFSNARTADAVVNALVQDAPAGFAPIGPLSWAGQSATGSRAMARATPPQPDKPAVFVLPGILGSHLKVGGQRVWLGWRVLGGLDRLAYAPGQAGVEDDGPIGSYYDELIGFLRETHEVIPFGFDWRRPLEEEAQRLAKAVEEALAARVVSGAPVRFVAHSMGGLLVRTMVLECPDVWQRVIAHPGGRLLMLGTPNAGSWAPMQVLSGDDNIGTTLAALGAPFQNREARMLMAQFPGLLQLQAGLLDTALNLGDSSAWAKLAEDDVARVRSASWWHRNTHMTEPGDTQVSAYEWGVPAQAVLNKAVALRKRLDAQCVDDLPRWAHRLALVVGRDALTPDGYEWAEEGFVYLNTPNGGDGRVTLAQALLPGVSTWTLDAEHGELPQCRQAFGDYLRLLVTGQANHLDPLWDATAPGGAPAAAALALHVRSRPSRGNLALARPAESAQGALASRAVAAVLPGGPALRITIVNGNLAFVRQPLLVGHYTSSQLSGAALAVNGMVGGVLADALEIGRYPQQAGIAQIFRNTAAPQNDALLPQPEGVVVIGLGPEGGLSETLLADAVCQGVLAWTEHLAGVTAAGDKPFVEGAPVPSEGVALAALLMGSGGIGFQPGNAARAIALGVRAANSRIVRINDLRQRKVLPYVAHLRLVELYLERAAEAWRGLQVHAMVRPGELLITPLIEAGEASLRRQVDSAYRGTKHDFISITSLGQDGQPLSRTAALDETRPEATAIQFRLDTWRARTEVRAVRAQSQLLQEMLQNASNARDGGTHIGRTLFQLLVPLEIEPYLAGRTQMLLEVDQGTAVVPWELLDTAPEQGGTGESVPWGVRSRLIRKLVTSSYRDAVRDAGRQADVLVIGEPLCKPEYGRLAGALREAQQVATLMRGAARVGADHTFELLRADATAVINALMDRPYRVLHVAAHGEQGGSGGVVLSGDTFLGPSEIGQMRAVPELVFVNCCHLAKVPDEFLGQQPDPFNRSAFAASTAEALIAIGVRCVVAAGWAVDDEPAELFAQVFYAQLLQGTSFVEAVGQAREATWRAHPDSNTWAAYQCYGDPDWRLHGADRPTARKSVTGPELQALYGGISSAQGVLIALEKLTVDARFEHVDRTEQHKHLGHLAERFGPVWGHQGAVAEAIGTAFIANGLNDAGIGWYERAVAANDGGASLRAAEQLSNQYARRAWKRVEALKADAATHWPTPAVARATLAMARTDIVAARDDLGALARMQPSIERHSLIGSACKRLAMLERRAFELEKAWAGAAGDAAAQAQARRYQGQAAAAERRALREMAQAYGRSAQLAQVQQNAQLYYPAINGLAARLVGLQRREDCAAFVASMAPVRAEVEARIALGAGFWLVACRIELDLYQALAMGQLAQDLDAIDALTTDLQGRVPARNNWETLLDQARFVLHRWVEKRWVSKAEKQAAQQYEARMQARATGQATGKA